MVGEGEGCVPWTVVGEGEGHVVGSVSGEGEGCVQGSVAGEGEACTPRSVVELRLGGAASVCGGVGVLSVVSF